MRCIATNKLLLCSVSLVLGFCALTVHALWRSGTDDLFRVFVVTSVYGTFWFALFSVILLKWTLDFHRAYQKKIQEKPDCRIRLPRKSDPCRIAGYRLALRDYQRGASTRPHPYRT